MDPVFRRKGDGRISLLNTPVADSVVSEMRGNSYRPPLSEEQVRKAAVKELENAGGNPDNTRALLGFHRIQFGKFRGETFRWILHHAPGYAGFLVNSMKKDRPDATNKATAANKECFKRYVESYPEGKEIIQSKRPGPVLPPVRAAPKVTQTSRATDQMTVAPPEATQPARVPDLVTVAPPVVKERAVPPSRRPVTPTQLQHGPVLPPVRAAPKVTQTSRATDQMTVAPPEATQPARVPDLVTVAPPVVKERAVPPSRRPVTPTQLQHGATPDVQRQVPLPAGWYTTLPKVDHNWVSKTFYTMKDNGQIAFTHDRVDKLWWYPPPPMAAPSSLPRVDRYFAHPLLLWMPRKIWMVKLTCPQETCRKRELTSCGIHQKIRHVIDVDCSYNIAAEYLECQQCKRKYVSWSHELLSQLDLGHRSQFPCLLTAKLACDLKVIRLLRSRGLGNSSSQIHKKLVEQHTEAHFQKVLQYLTDCRGFTVAASSGIIRAVHIAEPPPFAKVPGHKWLMHVYCQDVLHRLPEIKASITSVFGDVLKIDSTKKIVKKLAGAASRTAVWCTNIGNEHGQVLSTVLTAAEGGGIREQIEGVINRYTTAEVNPPSVMYTDRDCCGGSPLKKMLAPWNATSLRLDVWHFMRRFSAGLTTDSHLLYGPFMAGLSNCIFEWDLQDMNKLIEAKKIEFESKAGRPCKDAEVKKRLKRKELAVHCQRRTRGAAETAVMIDQLLEAFGGPAGCDSLGVPLIDAEKMAVIWGKQRKHTACIQDPAGVSLYTRTKTVKKSGQSLPVYRCARGSTSLESFHLHLNRFIPGTLAGDVHFQAYLLDGVYRWNKDRADMAVVDGVSEHVSYSGDLQHALNILGEAVLGKKLCPNYKVPLKYTEERLGIEYLYAQTGKILDINKTIVEESQEEGKTRYVLDDGFEEDEGFDEDTADIEDLTVPLVSDVFPNLAHDAAHGSIKQVSARPGAIKETSQRPQPSLPLQRQLDVDPPPQASFHMEQGTPNQVSARPGAIKETSQRRQPSLPLQRQLDVDPPPQASFHMEQGTPNVSARPGAIKETSQRPQPSLPLQRQLDVDPPPQASFHMEQGTPNQVSARPGAIKETSQRRQPSLPLQRQLDVDPPPQASFHMEQGTPNVSARPGAIKETSQRPQPSLPLQRQLDVDPPPQASFHMEQGTPNPTSTNLIGMQEVPRGQSLPLPLHHENPPCSSAAASDDTEQEIVEDSVDSHNIGGFDRVQSLAQYLCSLRNSTTISNSQAQEIVEMWSALDEFDKKGTTFSPRFSKKTNTGRFRATKHPKRVVEGVASTRRCFVGPNQGPATWPDCNRVTEAVIRELLRIFSRDVSRQNEKLTRFSMVLSAYRHIRECILDNPIIMDNTTLQMPEINKATLSQWYNERNKARDRQMLMQGIKVTAQTPPAEPALQPRQTKTTAGPALKPLQKPQTLQTGAQPLHQFDLPPDTSGTAKLKKRKSDAVVQGEEINVESGPKFVVFEGKAYPIIQTPTILPNPAVPHTQVLGISSVPYTTQRYRKRKIEQEKAGVKRRKYERKKEFSVCKKCGKDRNTEGHRQYFSNIYCPATASVSYEEWLEPLLARNYGKKKNQ